VTSLVLGLWDDLREKRLWPVALALVLALVAVPVLLRTPAEEAPAPVAGATASTTTAGGLPGPEAVLAGDGKPLVTLAVLDRPSDLERFDVKNPFKPLRKIEDVGAGDTAAGTGQATGGGDGGGEAGAPGGSSLGGGTGGGETGGGIPAPENTPSPPAPGGGGESEQRLTYAVDLTFDGPFGPERRYRNLPKLSMLPNTANPLLVYLGVSGSANGAVFLVDSTLTAQGGEAACRPSAEDCATVTIEPGEQQFFTDERDRRYFVRVDQIRERPIGNASASADASAFRAGGRTVRRFLPPLISDVLVRRVQR
jgi:hypothetical protein